MKFVTASDLIATSSMTNSVKNGEVILKNVSRSYGSHVAVRDISLAVSAGSFITLLGPSGCGKTTTLRMIAGLESNSQGCIEIDGLTVSDPAKGILIAPEKRNLGMVFQSYAIWPHMTVFDNVAYPLRARKMARQDIWTRVSRALELVELEAHATRPATALSGGQQQRVAIARALVFEPKLLLLDEPLSNLDARLRLQTGREFRKLQQELGITTIYVTHDQEEAMSLSDVVAVIFDGVVAQIGTPEEVYRRPASLRVADFFGSTNIVYAEVVSAIQSDPNTWRLAIQRGPWKAECLAGQKFSAGAKVAIVVRAENISITSGGSPRAGFFWNGVVRDDVFCGARRNLVIDTGEQEIFATISPLTKVTKGQNMMLDAPLEATWAVAV
jgi:iron(III) transport system ATP-binding protein